MTSPFKICAIVAMDEARVIGFQNRLPWHIPEDMKRFAQLTTGHTVLMGRKTYESLPDKFRPLPKRKNVVISRSPEKLALPAGVEKFASPEDAIAAFRSGDSQLLGDKLWVMGGGEIYKQTLGLVDEIYLTYVKGTHEGDVFLPPFEEQFQLAQTESFPNFSYRLFVKN